MTDDRDYTYEELLQRVFTIMRDKNPEMIAGEKKKFVMRPPQVFFNFKVVLSLQNESFFPLEIHTFNIIFLRN
jgi:hypothetical protein